MTRRDPADFMLTPDILSAVDKIRGALGSIAYPSGTIDTNEGAVLNAIAPTMVTLLGYAWDQGRTTATPESHRFPSFNPYYDYLPHVREWIEHREKQNPSW